MATIARYFRTALFASIVFALPGFSANGIAQTRVGKTLEQVEKLAAKEGKCTWPTRSVPKTPNRS